LEKPSAQLLGAYDDELGVTAAFNLNLLGRINRELGADFDLREFAHVAKINSRGAECRDALTIEAAASREHSGGRVVVEFSEGETIWTESSHKYSAGEMVETARNCRLPLRNAMDR
jgi:L-histidine Nalpha-methyltransferase